MSYTPTTWQTGDTITAEKLNNMESGIENVNEPFIVTVTGSSADKSYAEIVAAFEADKEVRLVINRRVYFLSGVEPAGVTFTYLDQAQASANFVKIESGGRVYSSSKSFMLPVFEADNGKGLVVKNGVWAKGFPEPFIVTCTPTSGNYSGVMDKTVAEINEAYEAGRKIYFRVLTGANTYAEVLCTIAVKDTALYPSYGGYTIDVNNNLFIYAYTGYTNDGTMNAYGASVFPLTPAT